MVGFILSLLREGLGFRVEGFWFGCVCVCAFFLLVFSLVSGLRGFGALRFCGFGFQDFEGCSVKRFSVLGVRAFGERSCIGRFRVLGCGFAVS